MNQFVFLIAILLSTLPLYAQTAAYEPTVPAQVAQLGRGTAETLDWHPAGNVLAVGGSLGLWLYDDTLTDLAYVPETGEIAWLAWSPDGDQLATVNSEDTVYVWDVMLDPYSLTRNRSWTFDDESYFSLRFAWSPEGDRLAVLTTSGAYILDVSTGENLLTIPDLISTAVWHPDGIRIAGAVDLGEETGKQVRVWDATSGEVVNTYFGVDSGLYWSDVIWSPDRSILVGITLVPATLHAWNVEDGSLLNDVDPMMGEFGAIFDIWWLEDESKLITAGRSVSAPGGQERLTIWDTTTWATQQGYFPIANAKQIVRNPHLNIWALATWDGHLMTWSLEQDEPLHVRSVHAHPANILAWSPDSRHLAVNQPTLGSNVQVWDLAVLEQPESQMMTANNRLEVDELRWRAGGGRLIGFLSIPEITAPGSFATAFIVEWDAQTGESLGLIHETPGYISRDGSVESYLPYYIWNSDFTRVATKMNDQPLTIAGVTTSENGFMFPDEESGTIEVVDHASQVVWSPDGTMLAVISRDTNDDTVTGIYDALSGDFITRVIPSFYMVEDALFWSPDSTRLAVRGHRDIGVSGQTEKRLDIIEVDRSIDITQHLAMVTDVDKALFAAWHPDSDYIAVSRSNGVAIYAIDPDIEPLAANIEAIPISLIPDVKTGVLAWSPDGMWLAGSHEDGTVRIWDVTQLDG